MSKARGILFTLLFLGVALLLSALLVDLIRTRSEARRVAEATSFAGTAMRPPLVTYKIHIGDFPSTSEGLAALVNSPPTLVARWHGPYIAGGPETLIDPWGRPYVYRAPAQRSAAGYDLFSLGPDGVESDDDIGNWPAPAKPAIDKRK